jgi:hypothetical protein
VSRPSGRPFWQPSPSPLPPTDTDTMIPFASSLRTKLLSWLAFTAFVGANSQLAILNLCIEEAHEHKIETRINNFFNI